MEAEGVCACKGTRSCALCEKVTGANPKNHADKLRKRPSFVYCSLCSRAYDGWDVYPDGSRWHKQHRDGEQQFGMEVKGIFVLDNFLSAEEEIELSKAIESVPWTESQSGRRKQDFGPKVNFKKRKVRPEGLVGFPKFVDFVVERFASVEQLADFRPVELCHLRYDPELGSSIDPHLDDSWLWGERLVTVNLGAPTVLTLLSPTEMTDACSIRVPMRPRSLVVLSSEARYRWPHAVLRPDVLGVRWALTFRELSSHFLCGGEFQDVGRELLERAKRTWCPSEQVGDFE